MDYCSLSIDTVISHLALVNDILSEMLLEERLALGRSLELLVSSLDLVLQ